MLYATGPAKTGHICTTTEVHFLSVHESYTHAVYPETLSTRPQMARSAFSNGLLPMLFNREDAFFGSEGH